MTHLWSQLYPLAMVICALLTAAIFVVTWPTRDTHWYVLLVVVLLLWNLAGTLHLIERLRPRREP